MMDVASGIYYSGKCSIQVCCYFLGTWGTEITRWSRAYRPNDLYHCNTSNGTERLNEDLKYEELEGATRSSLSELLTIIIEKFIPKLYMKYVELNVRCASGYKSYQEGIPSYLHNRPKSLVKHLLLLNNSVTTLMIDSVKPEDGEDVRNSEMDPDERKSRKTLNTIISTIEKRFSVRSSSIYSSSVQNYVVGFGNEYQPCWCTCPSFRMNRTLCKHFFAVINSGMATFNDLSPIFRFHPLHVIDNDLFHDNLVYDANSTDEKETQNLPFLEENAFSSGKELQPQLMAAILPLKERESAFKKAKRLLCSNVKVLQEQCFNIKGDVLFVQVTNEKVQELMDSLAANLSQNSDLVERDSPEKRKAEHSFIAYESLLQRKKRKHPYTSRVGSHAEMMWQYYRARISLAEMENPVASVASTILCKAKENDHVPGVAAKIEVETSQSFEKLTSNSLALQAPTEHEQSIEMMEVGSMSRTQVECKCELKDDTINLCQKIIVEQFDLSTGFEDTTLSPDKFTPVSEKFIQVLNASNKHWILVFRGQFGQINICDSLVTDGKYPPKIVKSISRIANCHGSVLELRVLPVQQQKNSIDCGVFAIAHAIEILHVENVEKSSFDVKLMRDHILVCLQLQKFSPFPKTNKRVYRCRSVFLFFDMYWPTFMMMLNQTTDILWQTATAVANGTARSA